MIYWKHYNFVNRLPLYAYDKHFYINAIFAFDTETTTFFRVNGEWVIQDFDSPSKQYTEAEKHSLVYIWQLAIDDEIIYGREITEFFEFWRCFRKFNPKGTSIIYVHNLGYDFSFLSEYLPDDVEVFARSKYRPIYAKIPSLGIEFRCSYMLTNMSLDACAKQFKLSVQKQKGSLIYNKARLPVTPLNEEELRYCEYDVRVIVALIREVYLTRYINVANIPVTQTGEVRRVVKAKLSEDKNHLYDMYKLKPDLKMYHILTRVLAGGYTHLNYFFNGSVLSNVASFDEASSYPAIMATRKFPVGKFRECLPSQVCLTNDRYNYLLYIRCDNIRAVGAMSYISRHKVSKSGGVLNDNGKIAGADFVEMWCTDLDYKIIIENYRGDIKIISSMRALSGYLPLEFVKLVLEQYKDKTVLKGIESMHARYMAQKMKLNSNFGMMITSTCRELAEYNSLSHLWENPEPLTDKDISEKLEKERPFLAYQYGIWVTAWGRYILWSLIQKIGFDVVYCDTDSLKLLNWRQYVHLIEEYNREQKARNEATAKERNIPLELFYPVDQTGEVHPLGYFEFEGEYRYFVSLGSKKYCYYSADHKFHSVVAGLKKSYLDRNGVECATLTRMTQFRLDMSIPNARTIIWHYEDFPVALLTDYLGNEYLATNKQGAAMANAPYTFGIEKDYADYIADGRNKYTNPFRLGE